MPIFLFLKQLIDMCYQFKVLDYSMVVLCLFLLGRKIWEDRIDRNLKKFLCPADYFVIVLIVIYAVSFLRYPSAYGNFFKLESCFLLYFLGRVYGSGLMKYGRLLAGAGYIVVYSNFFYRFYQFGFKFIVTGPEETLLNVGGLYYYKTDLAIGIIIAVLFIYMFSEVKWLKWITILPVCGYMVFYSGARTGQLIMAVEYLLIFLHELELRERFALKLKEKYVFWIGGVLSFLVLVFFIVLQFIPFTEIASGIGDEAGAGAFLEKLMHSRHIVWWDILDFFSNQSFLTRIFGIDLGTEYLHNSKGIAAHSMYVKQIYAAGYLGCFVFLAFLISIFRKLLQEDDRKQKYIVLILWSMLLIAGLTVESLESTQMSWFPMLSAGMLLTGKRQSAACMNEDSCG